MTEAILAIAGLLVVISFVLLRKSRSSGDPDFHYDPSEGERYPHRWGYRDTRFEFDGPRSVRVTGSRYPLAGYSLPSFLPFVEEKLDLPIRQEDIASERGGGPIPDPNLNEAFLAAVEKSFAETQISLAARERLVHSHGQLSVDEVYRVLYGAPLERTVDLVFYPQGEEDVRVIVQLANEHDVCLMPYGGGTNVSGALACPREERRMIVSVDMRRMNRILWIDEENYLASVEAGISGKQLEKELDARGYTSGHDPDSVELSTLGGWISTNASGMKKNKYGNIEDIVLEATLVTPTGDIESKTLTPRNSTGVQPRAFLFGSEGNLGIITKAVIKVHPRPERREYGSLVFPSLAKGVSYLKALRQTGALPASIRLVNNTEFRFGQALKPATGFWKDLAGELQKLYLFKLLGFKPTEMAACTIVMEGSSSEVRHQKKTIFGLAKKYGGISGGASNGKRGDMLAFGIAYIRDFLNQFHILGETFETSVPWNRIHALCGAVEKELNNQCRAHQVPGRPYLSYRVTQTYHTGVCVYFTMGFSGRGLDKPDEVYHDIERRLRQVILDNGGSLSHHHGVGKIRRDFLPQIQTEGSIEVLRQVKKAMDPRNVFGAANGVFTGRSPLPTPPPGDGETTHIEDVLRKNEPLSPIDPYSGRPYHAKARVQHRSDLLSVPSARRWLDVVSWGIDTNLYCYQQPLQGRSAPQVRHHDQSYRMLSSYDYLGLVGHPDIEEAAVRAIREYGTGTGGVRLLTGTSELHVQLESALADFKGTEACVTYSSGYVSNLAVLSALLRSDDHVMLDTRAHRSIADACRLSRVRVTTFAHNDCSDLEERLKKAPRGRRTLIITEGVYSMDGDVCPLQDMVALKKQYEAYLMIDEAHSFGVLGYTGRGVDEHFGLEPDDVDIWMGSLSKAIPSTGGFIAGRRELIVYLQHGSAPFMFSAAAAPSTAAAALAALRIVQDEPERRLRLRENARRLRSGLRALGFDTGHSNSHIIPVIVGTDRSAYELARKLYGRGVVALAVVSPAVKRGNALLRLCATAAQDSEFIDQALADFAACRPAVPAEAVQA